MEDEKVSDSPVANATFFNVSSLQTYRALFAQGAFFTMKPIIIGAILGIGIIGIIGNILTVTVFKRLGFSQTIHINYVALAVSDMCSILHIMWCSICYSPIIELFFSRFRIATDPDVFLNFTGIWPYHAFSKLTALLTAWISTERCLYVVFPIKAKLIITPFVTKLVLTAIFTFGGAPAVFAFMGCTVEWRFDRVQNQTRLFMFENNLNTFHPLSQIAFTLYGAVHPVLSGVNTVVSTTFLVIKLRKSATWRKRMLNAPTNEITGRGNFRQNTMSTSTIHVTKSVVTIACVFIVCSLLMSLTVLLAAFTREYFLYGKLRYLFLLNSFIALLLSEINSSVNILIFTIMGSRFRSELIHMFRRGGENTRM
ncbi:peptide receptor gpcr [Plakobranchus ocellatus]|uniref:Peptide receptor gpcr n=1 Tax=Plakobranchus ocellatus TaxID=259542 RepID=A0AAV3ZAK9_9GAST|nr:peptide receptor gpcr [Plakobranchus ocellatus]